MKRILLAALVCLPMVACDRSAPTATTSPEADGGATVAEESTLQRPAGQAFQAPLPQGVVLAQPHNATMDIQQENPNGTIGRRVEFEYLDGDAAQAMSEFAEAMAAAGFVVLDGPSDESGVVRQVFKKPGYGSVFARSQAQDPSQRRHELGIGFVVIAWPEGEGRPPHPGD